MRKDEFDLYRCPSCSLVFVHPQPSAEYLKEEVYSYKSGYQSNRTGDLSLMPEDRRGRSVLDYLQHSRPKGHILDVGCAQGQFMYWAEKRGFTASGVELNKRTADSAVAQGMDVYNGFIENAPFKKNAFDIAYLGEIIEHVNDPRGLARTCMSFLKPGGLLAITTPNLDCFWSHITFVLWRLFKIPWSSCTPPYHLFQFSSRNLDLLMEQEGCMLIHKKPLLLTRLKYELGMLHLIRRYKKSKKVTDVIFAAFSYAIYTLIYVVNIITFPFRRSDFNMIRIYQKS